MLASKPNIRATSDLSQWTNLDINVGLTAHNYGVLNLFTKVDESQTKELKYTVEIYKNEILDEFSSFERKITVQYLDDETIPIDTEYFSKIKSRFKDYYINKLVINGVETNIIPDRLDNNTVIKIYYGQVKGEEIPIENPKTGVDSSFKYYVLGFIAVITLFVLILRIKPNKSTN